MTVHEDWVAKRAASERSIQRVPILSKKNLKIQFKRPLWHRPGVSPAQRSPARTRPLRRVRAASTHADADQRAPRRTPAAQNRQCTPATAYPALSYSVASTLNKGAAGMQLVEAGLHAMPDPISQRPNRESPAKGGCGDAACGSWPASDSASSNTSAAISQTACKRGSAGKQLVEAGLRAIGTSAQHIPCYPAFQSNIRLRRDQPCNASSLQSSPAPEQHVARDAPRTAHEHTSSVQNLILK